MWQVKGQDRALAELEKSLREGRYAHAYLLVGPPQVGKGTLALHLAQAVNCLSPGEAPCGECIQCRHIAASQHADVVTIRPGEERSKTVIGIDEVREIQHQASLKPYEGRHRVFVFDGAEHMSEEAANALLKTLEEPPPQVLILLLTAHEEALLPTIRSRCRRVELRPMPMKEISRELVESHSVSMEEAEKLARLGMGCLGWAISAAGDASIMETRDAGLDRVSAVCTAPLEDRFDYASELTSMFYKNRDEAMEALHMWLGWWRDILLIKEGSEEFVINLDRVDSLRQQADACTRAQVAQQINVTLQTLAALEANANPRLALEVLMLGVPPQRSPRVVREGV